MSKSSVRYLVFDVESVADPPLVARLRYRAELMAKFETDFIPYTYQVPISIVVAKVAADFRLIDLVPLDEPLFRPHILTSHFWKGWEAYKRPTIVTFNGRTF